MEKTRLTRNSSRSKLSRASCTVTLSRKSVAAFKVTQRQANENGTKSNSNNRPTNGTRAITSNAQPIDSTNCSRKMLNQLTPNVPRARKTFAKSLCRNIMSQVNSIRTAPAAQMTTPNNNGNLLVKSLFQKDVNQFISQMAKLNDEYARDMVDLKTEYFRKMSALKQKHEQKINDVNQKFSERFEF